MKKVYRILASLLLLMLVISARPAAAAPRINAVFGGSVLESMNTGMSVLWNPALSAYNADPMVSVSIIGTDGFLSLQQQINNISNAKIPDLQTDEVAFYPSTAGYFIGYSGKWFALTVSSFVESEIHYNLSSATTVTLTGSYLFSDVPVIGNLAIGSNLHLFGGSKIHCTYDKSSGIITTDTIDGNGVSLDLGIISELSDQFHFGVTVRDVIYGFWGDRTYRMMSLGGTVFAEENKEYVFDRFDRDSEMIFAGGALQPDWEYGFPARTTLDLGVAFLPTERTKIMVDMKGLRFGRDERDWPNSVFASLGLKIEQTFSPVTCSLGVIIYTGNDFVFNAGAVYQGDKTRIRLALGFEEYGNFLFNVGMGWSY